MNDTPQMLTKECWLGEVKIPKRGEKGFVEMFFEDGTAVPTYQEVIGARKS